MHSGGVRGTITNGLQSMFRPSTAPQMLNHKTPIEMIGAIIGDIVGSRFEFNNTKSKDFELSHPLCDFTDDTICTIAIADAILRGIPYRDSLLHWCRKYPNPKGAYGGRFAQWLNEADPQPYNSWGNGSAMRVSPVGWAFLSTQEVMREAMATALPSHNHPEGIIGAIAVADAVFRLRHSRSINNAKQWLVEISSRYYGGGWSELPPKGVFDETCRGCVPLAFCITHQSTSFEDAIRRAVAYGGDSDTLAAIVGSMAGAMWGVPEALREEFTQYLPDDMLNVLTEFENKYGHE